MNALRPLLGFAMLFLAAMAASGASHQYRLAFTADPSSTMTIGWSQQTGTASGVEYRERGTSAPWVLAPVTVTRSYVNPRDGGSAPTIVSHFVELAGLQSDSAYEFRVVDTIDTSDVMWFKTAPASPAEFTFIAGGDSRTNNDPREWGMELVSKIRPLFVLYNGDFMDDGTYAEWTEWLGEWQMTKSADGRMYPIVPTHGNHENDVRDMMQKIFNISNPDAYYALSFGGTQLRVYTLNTELEPGVGYGAFNGQSNAKWNAQTAWLVNELQTNAAGHTFNMANYHRPMRPHTSGKDEGTGRIAAWAQPFFDYGMDVAIESDTHMVKHTFPLEPSTGPGSFQSFLRNDAAGTLFTGEGSWGAPKRPIDDDKPWTISSESFWQYKLISVTPSEMRIRTVVFEDKAFGVDAVSALSEADQLADPLAIPAGLDLWQSLSGEYVTVPFSGADVDNVEYSSTGSTWKYLDNGTDPGSSWNTAAFNDSTWASGPGQLGYGDGDEATVVNFGPNANDKYATTYFRKTFNVADASEVVRLIAWLLRDDGAIVYINGTEAFRSNMPEGPVGNSDYAAGAVGGSAEDQYFEFAIRPELLVDGSNVVAVEVHQSDGGSSDLSFDMVLMGQVRQVSGTAPAAPSALSAVELGLDEIQVTWTDNASDEVYFRLEARAPGGDWQILEDRLPRSQGNGGTYTYLNDNLDEGQTVEYQVRAYNQYGNSGLVGPASATTQQNPVPVIYEEDFDSGTFGLFTTVDVAGDSPSNLINGLEQADWHLFEFPAGSGQWFTRINGFYGDVACDDWLVSPPFNLDFYSNETLAFDLAYNFGGPVLEMYYSTDYDPNVHADPGTATWTVLPGTTLPSQGNFTFEAAGPIDLSGISGESVYIGFRYTSIGPGPGNSRVWEVDNFILRGDFTPPKIVPEQDFEASSLSPWTAVSVTSANRVWQVETRAGETGAFMNGFGGDEASDDWLISPSFALQASDYATFSFSFYQDFDGPDLQILISTDYTGGDPMSATWTDISPVFPVLDDEWADIPAISLAGHTGSNVHIAIRYISTGTGGGDGARLGVDNLCIAKGLAPQGLTVNFTASDTTVLESSPIDFNAVVNGGVPPYDYSWTFGDGGTSTDASPTYSYANVGTYTVTLQVTDSDTGDVTETKTGYITVNEATEEPIPVKTADLRVAAFNALLFRNSQGAILTDMQAGNVQQVENVAEIIQRVRPDVILLNEFDYVAGGAALDAFVENYLEVSQNGAEPITYEYRFVAPSNTGIPSGMDFNNNGSTTDPDDGYGFGEFPGQYGMAFLSRCPIDTDNIRTFQLFKWKDMPGNLLPTTWYSAAEQDIFRLSSKSHWDIPVIVGGQTIHMLSSHPTPPTFDGAEDRNGRRNSDEIRFWADYIDPAESSYIYDDDGVYGGLPAGARFVILGDQNADNDEGDSTPPAITQLVPVPPATNPLVDNSFTPTSAGSAEATGDATDTAGFAGGVRVDYVLPSVAGLDIEGGAVFWPASTDVLYRLVENNASSDHRMVWLDLDVNGATGYGEYITSGGYFSLGDPGTLPGEDFTGNGQNNAFAFAFALDPSDDSDQEGTPAMSHDGTTARVTYDRPVGATVKYVYEQSTSSVDFAEDKWSEMVEGIDYTETSVPNGDGSETVTLEIIGTLAAADRLFVRVLFTY